MLLDYHIHAAAHGEYNYSWCWINQFLDAARGRNLKEIGFTEHDEFRESIDFALLERIRQENNDIAVRIGVEVDYWAGREKIIKEIVGSYQYDYIIGSVHFIDGWAFDHPDYRYQFNEKDIDEVYARYFDLLGQAVDSGLFNIVGHIDLVKKWGHRPVKNKLYYYTKGVLNKIKKSGMTVEINTAGLRKPVAEMYPSWDLLEIMFDMSIPITLSSDAHHPSEVGEGISEAAQMAWAVGYREISSYSRGRLKMVPLVF